MQNGGTMASSVKVSKVIENYDLKLCNPGIDTDKIKITVPDINRPSLEWTGYFEHFDPQRVQIIGFTENSYVEQMDKADKLIIYDKLMAQRFPCIVFCRGMEPDQELIDAGTKYGVPVLITQKATSSFMAEIIRWLNVELAPCISIHGVLADVYGEGVLIMGESGIGKSTFVKLMMRFWDVNEGKINLDNKNIKEVNTASLRNSQTLVSQETYLFNETIMDNIKIGNANATKEEVIKAAKMASIHEFIETLPKGYDTKVGELGGNLSSGEKQRIGLARAFLSNGDVLILDEPTSNLDTLNEGEILKSIKENCEDKTIVLISHRKSTTAVCNKTYKLENSKLVLN